MHDTIGKDVLSFVGQYKASRALNDKVDDTVCRVE